MKVQYVTTDGGEELVLVSRAFFEKLISRVTDDEDVEDEILAAAAREVRKRVANGEERLVPLTPQARRD